MDEQAKEKPTPADHIAGLLILSGFMILFGSPLFGAVLALKSHPGVGGLGWFAVVGTALTAVCAAVGFLLIYIGAAICRWQWGYWPDVFWTSRKKSSAGS
jgi:hypothetical protein